MVSRRQILQGDFSGRRTTAHDIDARPMPLFGAACLPRHGIVCRSCGETCAVSSIVFLPRPGGVALPSVSESTCTSCGDCVKVCPVGALSLVPTNFFKELPA